ncbi:MAG: hypothetical protein R3E97_22455 [Candidatus Eisenbacteria bacterium]
MRSFRLPIAAIAAPVLLTLSAVSVTNAACDGAGHLRWSNGLSPFQYVPGGNEQGSFDLAQVGPFLLVPDLYWGLSSYEITSPGTAQLRDQLEGNPRRLEAQGDFVYLVEDAGVRVVEVLPTGQLAPRGSIGGIDPSDLVDIAVDGDYAYVAGWTGLRVLSIADPDTPSVVATLPGDCHRVVAQGDRAYVSRINGLFTVDVSSPTEPAYIGAGESMPNVYGLAIDGGYLYGVSTSTGVHVFDLADPDEPAEVAGLSFTGAEGIAIGDGLAIVGGLSACRIVDIADPEAPTVMALSRSAGCLGGVIEDGFAYLASFEDGLQILELGDGTSPEPVASLPEFGAARDLTRFGSHLAILRDTALQLLDVSDPVFPILDGSLPLSLPQSLCSDGEYLYVVANDELDVVDVSVPSSPAVIGSVPGVSGQIATADGGLVYVTFGNGLYVVDVSVPTQPVLISATPISTYAIESLAARGRDLYLAATFEGVGVLEHYDYSTPGVPIWRETAISSPISDVICTDTAVYTTGPREASAWSTQLDLRASLGIHAFGGAWYRTGLSIGPNGRIVSLNADGGFHLLEDDGAFEYVASGATPTVGGIGIADLGSHVYVVDSDALHVFTAPCEPSDVTEGGEPQTSGRSELAAFPNPTPGPVRLAWDGAGLATSERVVRIGIFGVDGRRIRSLAPHTLPVEWDGRDDSGALVPTGTVFARVETTAGLETRTIHVVR